MKDNFFSIEDQVYDETFDKTYRFLNAGISDNLSYEINTLVTTIETLNIYYGNNQSGRGYLSQIKIEAEIAATEVVLFELVELKKAQTRVS